jgi:outer membrane protein
MPWARLVWDAANSIGSLLACMRRAMGKLARVVFSTGIPKWSGHPFAWWLVLFTQISRVQAASQGSSPTAAPAGSEASSAELTPTVAPPVPSMTLAQALAYARAHQPDLRAARERFLAVAADARVPSAQWLPSAGIIAEGLASTTNNSTSTVLGSSAVDLPRIGGTAIDGSPRWQPYATTAAAIGLRQEVYDFGRIAALTAAGDALLAIERDRLEAAHLDVSLIVTQSYYAVRAAHAVLDAASQAEQRARVHRDYAEVAVKAGLRPPTERTRAMADLTRFKVGTIRATGNLRIARSVLAASVGYYGPELDTVDTNNSLPPTPSLAQVEQRALAFEPEVLQARDQQKAQQAQTRAIDSLRRPNLYLSASISGRAGGAPANNNYVPDGAGFAPIIPNYDAGLVFSWPVLEPVVGAAVRASKQREWAYDAEIVAAQEKALAQAQQVYRQTRVAESALVALAQAAEAARANYEQADARFKSGLGTSTELADAEAIRLEAEVQQAVGRFELAKARAQLARVMGD